MALGARVRLTRPDGSTFEPTGKAALLLAMAVLEGQAERRRVARLLWPGSPEPQARNNLRTLVHRLNQRFGAELLVGADRVGIDPTQVSVLLQDTPALLAALEAGGPQACGLLAQAGVEADNSEALNEWLEAARQRLHRQQLAALSETREAALMAGNTALAVTLARACVQLEPFSEQGHRQLMDTLAQCGDRAAALAAFEDCKALLRRQLGVLPDALTRTVQLRILQDEARNEPAVAAASVAAPVATPHAGLTRLGGAARYPLIEREAVLAEVLAALAQGRHVAIQGEAGVGKTRLLRQLAEHGNSAAHQIEQVSVRPGARDEPYAALAQLLQELQARRAPRIGVPEQVELARLAPLAFPGVQASQAGLSAPRLHAALRHWAGRLREAGVQRMVIDDVHYADAASQAAFAALLVAPEHATHATPTLLLAHRTDEIDASLAEALVSAQVHRQARCVTLPRLSLQGVTALLEAMHSEHSQAQAARLLQRTGGNPLFVIELAEHAREQAEQVGAGANLEALLRSRLTTCSIGAQQLAAVAAVAAADFSVELAAAVTGQPPLALMPAWSELQQRGLFADNGLAHDLIRDAVMGAVPTAIGRTLHRQVASHLEGLGTQGARVLGHWLAAQDFDHALPHAVHQLQAAGAAGLGTLKLENELLGLIGRVSDTVLLGNLWLTANLKEVAVHADWSVMQALVHRVERLHPTEAVVGWLAFEHARLLSHRDSQMAEAYAQLNEAAERMSDQGVERAWVELELCDWAYQLDARRAHAHVMRATTAVAALPVTSEHRRLRLALEQMATFCLGSLDTLRSKQADIRVARRRHDLGAVAVTLDEIGSWCVGKGLMRTAYRRFRIDARAGLTHAALQEIDAPHFELAVTALSAGRLDAALHFLDFPFTDVSVEIRQITRTLVWLRLGQWARARAQADEIDPRMLDRQPYCLQPHAIARRDIHLQAGTDPLPALREVVVRSRELGVGGINHQLLEWQVALRAAAPDERMAIGAGLIEHFRSEHADARRLPLTLLEVAEAHAEAGSAGGRTLALEAARELRRGRTVVVLYLPDGLVRCAKLLEATDPLEAASLMHVARRWVRQALPHVPEFARQSFMTQVPVNRLLFGDDAVAAIGAPA